MAKLTKIHQNKTPIRRHFIPEWLEARGLKPVDITNEIGADKGLVSRWINQGVMPGPEYQAKLAALFEIAPEALLRHPDDDWLARFFAGRDATERDRIKKAMELAWPPPKKDGTNNH